MNRRIFFYLAAAAFAFAALYHLAAILLPSFGRVAYAVNYPVFRHVVFIAVDFTFAALFLLRPNWLVWPYLVLYAQVLNGHGLAALKLWRFERRVDWISILTVAGMTLGLALLIIDRRRRTNRADSDYAVSSTRQRQ